MPHGKPRVYFTCHPDDFSRFFDKICEDIWKTHDCVIYYTDDMLAPIPEKDRELELDRMNLFIVPVTYKLLSEKNRAMDEDIAYAKKAYIPILPFMMEPELDALYSRPDFFGEVQYINPYSTDTTEISYTDKLKKYLESVLISDEMAARVRAAFDTYIFLSYRKKDRKHANELMRIIHSRDEFRDIAVWYDEFLTPGESFKENIDKMLRDSKLFTLLVTPNLLEDGNFVMTNEYPEAKRLGMDILPAEMEKTDRKALKTKYDGIPDCADPRTDNDFHARLLDSLTKIAKSENDSNPEHNFLIGLAYLEGIDVEIDRDRGLALIESAAHAELPEAMYKLYEMYDTGAHVKLSYDKALFWAERIYNYNVRTCGEEHPDTLASLSNLSLSYKRAGNLEKSFELAKMAYSSKCKVLGEEHPSTLISIINLAVLYDDFWEYDKALKLTEKAYSVYCKTLGEEHPDTIRALFNIACVYDSMRNVKKSQELSEKAYSLRCKVLGEEHPESIKMLSSLSRLFRVEGTYQKALEFSERAYSLGCKVFGEDHIALLSSLANAVCACECLGLYQKCFEYSERYYILCTRLFGIDDNKTQNAKKILDDIRNKL